MADQAITAVQLKPNEWSAALTGAAMTAANDATFVFNKKDNKILFIIQVTADGTSGNLTVKDGVDGANNIGDYTLDYFGTYADNDLIACQIETSRFKAMSGTDRGKVRFDLSGDGTANVIAVILP